MKLLKIPFWPFLLGPSLMLYVGSLMNWVVIGANHGYMPVQGAIECVKYDKPETEGQQVLDKAFGKHVEMPEDILHICMDRNSRLKILADWLYIPKQGTASPGDILQWGGESFLFYSWAIWAALMILKDNSGAGFLSI